MTDFSVILNEFLKLLNIRLTLFGTQITPLGVFIGLFILCIVAFALRKLFS